MSSAAESLGPQVHLDAEQNHDMVRTPAKQNETLSDTALIKHDKYYVPPSDDGSDLKELLKRLGAAGAGRPVDKHGIPMGPWTPELLAAAISQIDANKSGIELRTVQLWFQDNDKGISPENIRWLARIFGCNDPEATSKWQTELSAAQSRLVAKRRAQRKKSQNGDGQVTSDVDERVSLRGEGEFPAELGQDTNVNEPRQRFGLAAKSEAIFSRGSPLDLAASVFAGAVALGFVAYFLGIHSVNYIQADGQVKQVGFLWTANWTLVFMLFLPLYFAFVVELLAFWKTAGRPSLTDECENSWAQKVDAYSVTYWVVFLICILFAGLLQWVARNLIPLMTGDTADYVIDWGTIAVVSPETVSVGESIAFTGLAYLYMSVFFYLFFAGFILLYSLAQDYWEISDPSKRRPNLTGDLNAIDVGTRIMRSVFRCTVLALLIAISMKLQSAYLASSNPDVFDWLYSNFAPGNGLNDGNSHIRPTHFSSLLVAMTACVVFFHGAVRVQAVWKRHSVVGKLPRRGSIPIMTAIIAVLAASYMSVGAFPGFSILLGIGLLLAIYGLFDPEFGGRQTTDRGDRQGVP